MRPTELPRSSAPSGLKNGTKLLRLKINRHSQQQHPQQHAADTAPSAAVGTSSSSSSGGSQQSTSLLYSAQLWQAAGYTMQRHVVSRDVYFPELSAHGPMFKQLPSDCLESGQQKRAKLVNGQYRPRAAAAAAADTWQPAGGHHKQQQHSRHITPGLAAAAAAAAERQRWQGAGLVSPSSSSSQDYAGAQGPSRQQCSSSHQSVQQLRELPVAWPLRVSIKGRRSSRQRRSSWAQWQAVLQPDAFAAAAAAAVPAVSAVVVDSVAGVGSGVVAMDVEQQPHAAPQHLADLEHQQSGVLQDCLQQQQQEQQPKQEQPVLQPRPLRPLQANVQQQQQQQIKQQQQRQAAALLQELAPATPLHPKVPHTAFAAVSGAAAGGGGSKQHVADPAAGASEAGLVETSTSSEQTHDGLMHDSPRDRGPVRNPLSSWPSSSTDSIGEAQQQQQQQLLLLQQQRQGKGPDMHGRTAAPAAAAGGWHVPSSPLPAAAL